MANQKDHFIKYICSFFDFPIRRRNERSKIKKKKNKKKKEAEKGE